jgi:hypothetical protein
MEKKMQDIKYMPFKQYEELTQLLDFRRTATEAGKNPLNNYVLLLINKRIRELQQIEEAA